ncbi:hypothetical protein [Cucumibacter marinus]|uniref:hypothetical protein n=1 Tax=Cucumibacter marinus TaxID=1121252 RepID=UPI000429DCE9|nr:hypothetical protein [Cucumibacter marinus]
MTRLQTFGLIALVILALLVGRFLYSAFALGLLFHPETRYLYDQRNARHGTVIDLVPDLFEIGESRKSVVSRLATAGFEPWTGLREPRPGNSALTFHISAGFDVACRIDFFVDVEFDIDGKLTAAENRRSGGCL